MKNLLVLVKSRAMGKSLTRSKSIQEFWTSQNVKATVLSGLYAVMTHVS